jgi:hypothetical protein
VAIDTLKAEQSGLCDYDELLRMCKPWNLKQVQEERDGYAWYGATWQDPELPALTLGAKVNQTGAYLWFEGSIGKYLYGDNCRLLSAVEACEGVQEVCGAVEGRYKPFLTDAARPLRERWEAKRLDMYHQRRVPSSPAVVSAWAGAIGNKARVAQYLTTVEFHQSREKHMRAYDKGRESGKADLLNVLRHEEQVRGRNNAGYFLNIGENRLKVEEARAYMNKRFEGWPETGLEVPDVGALIEEHGTLGAAAVGLVLLPELEPVYKASLAKNTFFRYRRLATEYKRRKVQVDLRVPEDAWQTSDFVL